MQKARLATPGAQYLDSYLEACREFKEQGTRLQSLHDPDLFEVWRHTIFDQFEDNRLGRNLPMGFVPSTTFWLVEDGQFIGVGNLRHFLTPSLKRLGGHIGYAIRPSRWNRGYGTLQLKLLLDEAAKLGITKALITCDENNMGSWRVMEKNGAVYQDTVDNVVDGVPQRTRRYWADTPAAANCYLDTAHLYDFNNRFVMTEDVPFYRALADEKRGDILELACGTGRITLPLLEAGHTVTGLDLSGSMLRVFREKLDQEGEALGRRVQLVQANMARFALGRVYDLVMIPFRAFQALTDRADAKSCLACVREHMAEDGWFTVNAFNPPENLDSRWCHPELVQWERRDPATGWDIRKLNSNDAIDTEEQLVYPSYAYEVTKPDGSFERVEEHLALRYYTYGQLRSLLEESGFSVLREYGWYDRSPVEGGQELIFVCGKTP